MEVVVVRSGVGGHRRVKEPTLAYVDAAEKLPIPFQSRMQRVVGRARRKALESLMQIAGTEDTQHHELVEIRPAAGDPDLLTNDGTTAVAAHGVVGLEQVLPGPVMLGNRNPDAVLVLRDCLRRPSEIAVHSRKPSQFLPQHRFHPVLGQPVVRLKIIWTDELSLGRSVPVGAHQIFVGHDPADGVVGRHDACGPQLVGNAPEIEVLERALREILPLRDPLQLGSALDQGATHSPQPQLQCESRSDRPSAHDHHLVFLFHSDLARRPCVEY